MDNFKQSLQERYSGQGYNSNKLNHKIINKYQRESYNEQLEYKLVEECEIIMYETGCNKNEAFIALRENCNDTVSTIQKLKSLY
jgi:hypothetical protein